MEETLIRLETNHLVHLQKQIDKIDARMWAIAFGVALQIIAVFVAYMSGGV